MNKSKKMLATSFSLALALLMLVGLTLAYLTDQRTVNNFLKFGTGNNGGGETAAVQVSLTETEFAKTATTKFLGNSTKEVSEATLSNIKPGDKIKKDPAIQNIGKDDIYIRVKMDITEGEMTKLAAAGLKINPAFVKIGDYYYYGAGTQGTVVTKGSDAIDFFVLDGDRVSMVIPTSWTAKDFEALVSADGSLKMPITVEAIQADNFGGQLPWKNDDGTEVVAESIVTDNNR